MLNYGWLHLLSIQRPQMLWCFSIDSSWWIDFTWSSFKILESMLYFIHMMFDRSMYCLTQKTSVISWDLIRSKTNKLSSLPCVDIDHFPLAHGFANFEKVEYSLVYITNCLSPLVGLLFLWIIKFPFCSLLLPFQQEF